MVDSIKFSRGRFRDGCFVFDQSVRASDYCEANNVDHFCTAKRVKPYVKQFVGERDFDVIFAIDVSSSQMFGSAISKSDFVLKLANGLFTIAHKVGDRVGLVSFSEKIEFYRPPCTDLCAPNLGSRKFGIKSDPRMAAEFLQNMLKISSVIFFVSDFLYPNKTRDSLMGALKALSKRHDLVCVQLLDQIDAAISPLAG